MRIWHIRQQMGSSSCIYKSRASNLNLKLELCMNLNFMEDDKPARHIARADKNGCQYVTTFQKETMAFQDPCLAYFLDIASYCSILME